jgi:hypothetical protein
MNKTGLVGWTPGPHERGTIDLIWSCLLVIFTATWTVIHLNLPGKDDSLERRVVRKLRWVMMAILAPDLVTLSSAAQWKSATDSVQHMHDLGHKTWTLEHAFFADSGGFWLESSDYPAFPITAASIRYLVKEGYLEYPSITREEIWDKSKADKFAKGFALIQSGWLVLQTITRASLRLPISPLELFTIAFVVSTVMSYFFWLHKPQHVTVPTYLRLSSSDGTIATILKEAGPAAALPFSDTPFDFIEKPLQVWKRRPMLQHFDLKQRPLERRPNDTVTPYRLLNMTLKEKVLLVGPSTIHSIIHLLGWNFVFPTRVEQYLWRGASLVLTSGLLLSVAGENLLRAMGFQGQPSLIWIWVQPEHKQEGMKNRIIDIWGAFITFSMVVARLCIIGEVLASLRALPEDVYQTVNWTGFIPHV